MARPSLTPVPSGTQGWDGPVDDNFNVLAKAPLPIHESASLTEANLQSTFPAASFDRCLVWVNHTVLGYTLYRSTGSGWVVAEVGKSVPRSIAGVTTLAPQEPGSVFLASGTMPYTITLPSAANAIGRTLTFKTLVTGTLTIDGAGAETIDGAATKTITSQYGVLRLFSDGTSWHIV